MKIPASTILIMGALTLGPASAQTAPGSQTGVQTGVRTENQPAFSVIGVAVRTNNAKEAGGDGEIPKLWQRMMQGGLVEAIPARADDDLLAVYSDYQNDEKSDYTYLVGARVTSTAKVPDGFVAVTVPAGNYAVVTTDQGPLPQVIPKAWRRIWQLSPGELGGARAFQVDYEHYPAGMDPQNAEVEIHLGLK